MSPADAQPSDEELTGRAVYSPRQFLMGRMELTGMELTGMELTGMELTAWS